jgi:hypothetical protein
MSKISVAIMGCGVALALLPVFAMADSVDGLRGSITGDYSNTHVKGLPNADTWGVGGSGVVSLGAPNIDAELDGSYHRLSDSGADANIWNIGGSAFWAPGPGRLGATVTYTSLDFSGSGSGLNAHATTYGGFGEYYIGDMLTLGAKGGGLDGTVGLPGFGSGSASGSYVGGEVIGYLMPDLALSGDVDYTSIQGGHLTSFTASGEYLISESMPISIFGGYTNTQISGGGGHSDTWFAGLRFYLDGNPTLIAHQRNGTLGWIGSVSGLQAAF